MLLPMNPNLIHHRRETFEDHSENYFGNSNSRLLCIGTSSRGHIAGPDVLFNTLPNAVGSPQEIPPEVRFLKNQKTTTGENHEKNYSQDRSHNTAALGSGHIVRSGRWHTSPCVLSNTLPKVRFLSQVR